MKIAGRRGERPTGLACTTYTYTYSCSNMLRGATPRIKNSKRMLEGRAW